MEKRILVTGATGYVGGRLVPKLLKQGYTVRCFARSMDKVRSRPWGNNPNIEVFQGDMHDLESLRRAVEGCEAVYYLVHSMEAKNRDFGEADRHAAYTLVRALKGAASTRVIYLSGLVPIDREISLHLKSRAEVAEILSLADASLTTLRAAQLIGSGSASFEMLRYAVGRMSVMPTPKWIDTYTQPIAVSDAIAYLATVLTHPETAGETYDICGPDVITYKEMITMYADVAGLRQPLLVPFHWMTPGPWAWIAKLVTPVPYALARPLIEGMRNEVICRNDRIRRIIPFELTPIRTAFERALGHVRSGTVETSWHDAGQPDVPEWLMQGDAVYAKGQVYSDGYSVVLDAEPHEVWEPVAHIGGETGWYGKNALWRLRGAMDILSGGPGIRRGRRSNDTLYLGDCIDFWRVIDLKPEKRLLLLTEMRMPGEGLLDFRITPQQGDVRETTLSAYLYFRPHGLKGRAYWYLVSPLHRVVFFDMLKTMARRIGKRILQPPVRVQATSLDSYEPLSDICRWREK